LLEQTWILEKFYSPFRTAFTLISLTLDDIIGFVPFWPLRILNPGGIVFYLFTMLVFWHITKLEEFYGARAVIIISKTKKKNCYQPFRFCFDDVS
jgi:hypothetical protein